MQKITYALLSVCLIFISGCRFWQQNPPITEINFFHEVDFNAIQPDTLVIFDVDETLIQPRDAYLKNLSSEEAQSFNAKLFAAHPEVTDWNDIMSLILMQADKPLIEPDIIPIIKQLQLRGISIIACTNMTTDSPYGKIQSTLEWRYAHLKSLGFEGSFGDIVIKFDRFERKPVFYKGILATDRTPKGPVIGAFLDAMHLNPKEIIMFDDSYEYLLTVDEECKKRGIVFEGYEYKGGEHVYIPWDEELATVQAEYIIKNGIWLSDTEARELQRLQTVMLQAAG